MKPADMKLIEAEASLRWAADGVWSARVTPVQSQALLAELERLRRIERDEKLRADQRDREQRERVERRFGGGADNA